MFLCGQNAELSGIVYFDVYAAGVNILLKESSQIGRDINVSAQNISLNGLISRNVNITGQKISVSKETTVYGNFKYYSDTETDIPEGVVEGDITFEQTKTASKEKSVSSVMKSYAYSLVSTLVITAAIWLCTMFVAPTFLGNASELLEKKFWPSFGLGFGSLILIPIIIITLLITVIGIPLAFVLLCLYVIAILVANAISSIAIAEFAVKKYNIKSFHKNFWHVLATSALIWIITKIPFIGWWIAFVVFVVGMGMLIVSICNKDKEIKE